MRAEFKWTCIALGIAIGAIFLASQRIYSAGIQLQRVSDKIDISVNQIAERMVTYRRWQDDSLREYQARRTFHAATQRFNMDSTLEVRTFFHWPYSLQSTVLRQEGSSFVREHVFDKILEAETEFASKDDADIVPQNYDFALIGKERCDDRPCWHLSLTPKRKDKYLLDGDAWVDTADYGVTRIHGSPSKRVSIWITNVDIDKRMRRIEGMWLTEKIDSTSTIRFAGSVRMQIDYVYDIVSVINPASTARK
jgi:hypothetical protein